MKTAIVTGANRGLGLACAHAILARPGWRVVLACRDPAAAIAAADGLRRRGGSERVLVRELDLASLANIRAFAAGTEGPVDALVCNAGVQLARPGILRTKDGFEATFGVNFLGHFLLTNLLLPRLARPGRVVFVASGTHDPKQKTGMPAPVFTSAQDLAFPKDAADDKMETSLRRYTTSKLCIVYGAYEMERRLRAAKLAGIDVNAMDPGMMPGTALARDFPGWMRWGWNNLLPVLRLVMPNVNSPTTSGRHLAALATDPRFAGVSGRYFEGIKEIRSSELSYDSGNARALWEDSCRLVGLTANGIAAAA
ncbi:MAG TPA: SDR family NAD(P)-dependent oxidoreductase [Rhizomicrobium sp.]